MNIPRPARQPGGQHLGTPDTPLRRLISPTFLFDPNPPPPPPSAPAPPAAPEPPAEPTYTPPATQADLDRIVGERLARERAKFPTADELAQLRQKAEAHDALAQASLTAEQQANARAEAAEAAAAAAKAQANTLAKRTAILAAASQVKDGKPLTIDPAMVADLLANSDAVTIDDAGQVTGAETAVQTLLTEKPYLAGGNAGAGGGSNGGGTTSFGGGHGRGGAGESDKGSVSKGEELFDSRKRKPATTSS